MTVGANGLLSQRTLAAPANSLFYTYDPGGNVAQRWATAGYNDYAFDAYGRRAVTLSGDYYTGCQGQWGGYFDSDLSGDGRATGPVWLGRRFYDPAGGRFLTRDPSGYGGGADLYAYCGGDPVNLCDPTGLNPQSDGGDGAGAGGGAGGGDGWNTLGDGLDTGLHMMGQGLSFGLYHAPPQYQGQPGANVSAGLGGAANNALVTAATMGLGEAVMAIRAANAARVAAGATGAESDGSVTLYRIINRSDPLETVSSNSALGKAPRGPEITDPSIHDSVSMWDSLEAAQQTALKLKNVKGYAELKIPSDALDVTTRKTFGAGHYSVSGDASQLLNYWGRSILK